MSNPDTIKPIAVPRLRCCPKELSSGQWRRFLHERLLQGRRFEVIRRGRDPGMLEFEIRPPQASSSATGQHVILRGNDLGENHCTCFAFTAGTLGTCEHIESALNWLRRQHGKMLPVQERPLPYSEIFVRYGARHRVTFRPADDCPGPVLRAAQRCFDRRGRLDELRAERILALVRRAEELNHELLFREDARNLLAWVQHRHWLTVQIRRWLPRGIHSRRFEELLKEVPPLFQRDAGLRAASRGRIILADPAGFGKPVQAIVGAELLALAGVRRTIVVTTESSVSRWSALIDQYSQRKAIAAVGSAGRRSEAFEDDAFYKIACYDHLDADLPWLRKGSRPDLLILDQVHRLRDQYASVAKSVTRLESEYLFLLTSMAPSEAPGPLLSLVSMADRYREGPLERFLEGHQLTDPRTLAPRYRETEKIDQSLSELLLRRDIESIHRQLPPFLEERRTFPMTPLQGTAHGQARELADRMLRRWKESESLAPVDLAKLQRSLDAMHRAAAAPMCVDRRFDQDYFSDTRLRELAGELPPGIEALGPKGEEFFRLAREILQEPEVSVVLFSKWSEILDQLAEVLEARRWEYVQVDRRMSRRQRRMLLDQFERRPDARLLLANDGALDPWTLTGKMALVHFDQPWWRERLRKREMCASAVAKSHPVKVYHLLTQSSLEEAILGWDDEAMLPALEEMRRRTVAALFRSKEADLFCRMAEALMARIADPIF